MHCMCTDRQTDRDTHTHTSRGEKGRVYRRLNYKAFSLGLNPAQSA
jgi:hypothetical protein